MIGKGEGMLTVWKYRLVQMDGWVKMRRGARLLEVRAQEFHDPLNRRRSEELTLYALVDTNEPDVERRILVVDTGDEISIRTVEAADRFYVGTVAFPSGRVQHVFDGGLP